MSRRIVNAQSGRYSLDIYADTVASYRCEIRNEREDIVFIAAVASLVGDGGGFERIRSYFSQGDVGHIGAALVAEAEAELKAGGAFDMRPVVPGWKVTEVVAAKLKAMASQETPDEIRLKVEWDDETRARVAAAAALAIKMKFDVRERQ